MVTDIEVCGAKDFLMVMEYSHGEMEVNIRVSLEQARKMVMVF